MMTDFVNLIQGTTSHCVSIEDATQTVALIEKIKAQYHHR